VRAPATAVACAVLAVALARSGVAAQAAPEPETRWPGPEVGVRVGYDNSQKQEVLGALLRIPVIRSGHVELIPGGDVTFLPTIEEYQFNLEAVYLLSGRNGGFYGGGGIGWRNSLPSSDLAGDKQTFTTYSVVAGIKFPGVGPLSLLFEFRRIIADELELDPQLLAFGATIPLW
jgi:opacity protein-like surface antigen